MKRLHVLALVAVVAAALAVYNIGTVMAQGHSMGDCHGSQTHSMAQITQLHDQLKLSADQESAWQTMVASMKNAHSEHMSMPNASQMTAPQHIDAVLAMFHEHETQMTAVATSVKAFYETLSADQRATFDRAFQSGGMTH